MPIPVVTVFIDDDTIRIIAYSYSDAGVLEDCTSASCTLTDSASAKKLNAAAMSKTATGTYESKYTILTGDPHGQWTGVCRFLDGTYPTNISFSVKVV